MKKVISLLITLILAISTLVACGDKVKVDPPRNSPSEKEETTTQTETPKATETAEPTPEPIPMTVIKIPNESGDLGPYSLSYPADNKDFILDESLDYSGMVAGNFLPYKMALLTHPKFSMLIGYGEFDFYYSGEPAKDFNEAVKMAQEKGQYTDYVRTGELGGIPYYTQFELGGYLTINFPSPGQNAYRRIVLFSDETVEKMFEPEVALALFELPEVQDLLATIQFEGEAAISSSDKTEVEEDMKEEVFDGEYLSLTLKDGWYISKNALLNEYQYLQIDNDSLNGKYRSIEINKTDLDTPDNTALMILNTFDDSEMIDPITINGIEYLVVIKNDNEFNLFTGHEENAFGTGPCTISFIIIGTLDEVMPILETVKLK